MAAPPARNDEDGRTLWYHDHAIHLTAEHVYKGLAGFFVQEPSPDEIATYGLDRLPSGEYDIPLMFGDMQFTANGTMFFNDPEVPLPLPGGLDAAPRVGDTEKWVLENKSGGWFHPVHIHLVDFQVLRRNGRAPFPYKGALEDVVYVGPNERVEVLVTFHRRRPWTRPSRRSAAT